MKTILRYAQKFCTNRKSSVVGLDINESYIAMAEIIRAKNHHYCLENFAFVPFLHQLTASKTYQQDANDYMNPVSNPDTIRHLTAIFAHSPTLAKKIALALPLNLVISKTLTLPCKLKSKEIVAALKLHLKNSDELDYYQHSKIASSENDNHIISVHRLHCDLARSEETWFIAAAPKAAVHACVDSLHHASLPLKVAVLDVDLYACARAAVLLELSPKNSFVIVNINAKTIQFGLVVNSNIIETSEYNFDRNESIGAIELSQEFIAQTTYEKIKAFLQNIKQPAETIILCGPKATAKFKKSLSAFNIEVILADPFQHLELGSKLKATESRDVHSGNDYNLPSGLNSIGPQMMLCCGLSLHGAIYDDRY